MSGKKSRTDRPARIAPDKSGYAIAMPVPPNERSSRADATVMLTRQQSIHKAYKREDKK